ncbi:50S ribosomal protein L25 [Membranicola marinus]|uniref:Large ribosomal subunit protein bL25 n=1 Tax=Membranihabitans marinus TaxID=1227546 RepID=A0A953HKR5_9BACT|nr:50S ribosomal protein L25 [Membranihabitans marinus]MBY5957699.1 50S ribosomal protein L25 [Membranihabitans marinus]
MQEVKMSGELRSSLGKKSSRDIRKQGKIPCVLYGGGDTNIHFTLEPNDVKHIIFTPEFKSASIEVDGESYRSIVKDVQFHPVTDQITHIDFLALYKGVKVKTQIPLRSVGEAPGTKEGGNLILKMRTIDIVTTPQYLVDELTVDVSDLELGTTKRIKDIVLPENIKVLQQPNTPIASIEIPRILKTATPAAEGEEELDEDGEPVEGDESSEEGAAE